MSHSTKFSALIITLLLYGEAHIFILYNACSTIIHAPLPNSEQTNLPSSNHTYTKLTPKHIHHHCVPLCNINTHDTHHLFNCTHIRTTLSPLDLWTDPAGVTALLARWTEKLAGGPQTGTSDSPHQQGSWEWVDNNSPVEYRNKNT